MQNPTDYHWISTAIGWTILHSTWQITLIGGFWFLILSAIKKASPSTKYIFSILAMFLIVMISGLTLFSEVKSRYPVAEESLKDGVLIAPATPLAVEEVPFTTTADFPPNQEFTSNNASKEFQAQEWLSPEFFKILALCWLVGVVLFGIRFLIQWRGMQRLAIRGTQPFDLDQLNIFKKLQGQLGIKKNIRFLQSERIAGPLTFGHFKPVVLLPLGMINGFPPEQIEAIILHELAHIQRNDFLINTLQTWLEILFFYHPLIWIISKRIRTIRETLCDDEVIRVNKNKMAYAASLLNLQKYFLHNKNQLVMNAKGNKSELTHRIHRLFETTPDLSKKKKNINAYLFGLIFLIAMGSFAFSDFSYPTVSVAVDKMNVLYIGIDNPVTIAVAGVSTEKMKVESEHLKLSDQGNGHFNVKATKPGKATIKVTADGHAPKEIEFRVKRIPDPMAKVLNTTGGRMAAETMKTSQGVDAVIDCFEYDARCSITSFNVVVVPKNEDPVESINRSGQYNEMSKKLIQKVKAGDIIYYDNVECNCPGDAANRKINSMVFKIY